MYLSDILERLSEIRADLRQAYRYDNFNDLEKALDELTCLYKDIEYMEREGKDGKATDRVGEAEADREHTL